MQTLSSIFFIGFLCVGVAQPASIQIETAAAYIHGGGSLVAQLGTSSTGYLSTLDSNNVGTFGWSYTNDTGGALSRVRFLGFVDADLDRETNTFFNEYGVFHSLNLAHIAPAGAIAPSSWQIDEPGFLFGTILTDLQSGVLTNVNNVPSSSPDDVSLALGFDIGDLQSGQTATMILQITRANLGGLQQLDPESNSDFYFTGYATVTNAENPIPNVPEPSSVALILSGVLAIAVRYRNSAK